MKLAAVMYARGEGQTTDALLTELAVRLKRRGFKLAGAVQSNPTAADREHCDISLEDLATGRRIQASNDQGAGAQRCRLDAGALEDSVGLAASALGPDTDLVVINRFGKREAEGHGFRSIIETAVLLGVPVLVGLNQAHLDAWTAFVGGEPRLLEPEFDAVSNWCTSALSDRLTADQIRGDAPGALA